MGSNEAVRSNDGFFADNSGTHIVDMRREAQQVSHVIRQQNVRIEAIEGGPNVDFHPNVAQKKATESADSDMSGHILSGTLLTTDKRNPKLRIRDTRMKNACRNVIGLRGMKLSRSSISRTMRTFSPGHGPLIAPFDASRSLPQEISRALGRIPSRVLEHENPEGIVMEILV